MQILHLIIGATLALAGRRLFWLFVAGIGFIATASLAARGLSGQPEWAILLLALAAGVVGGLLAVFVQRVAIAAAGFLGGGYLTTSALGILGVGMGQWEALIYVAGGIAGAVLLSAVFDWALIGISALSGAAVIAQTLALGRVEEIAVFVVVFVVGAAIQAGTMRER